MWIDSRLHILQPLVSLKRPSLSLVSKEQTSTTFTIHPIINHTQPPLLFIYPTPPPHLLRTKPNEIKLIYKSHSQTTNRKRWQDERVNRRLGLDFDVRGWMVSGIMLSDDGIGERRIPKIMCIDRRRRCRRSDQKWAPPTLAARRGWCVCVCVRAH